MAIIGIDIGTQSLKVVVTDDRLRVLGSGSVSYRPSYPQPGWAVQDPQLWLDGLRPAIDRALRAAQVQPSAVAAIGIAAQLDGCVPVDAAGHALAPGIIWMDRRAEAEVRDIPAELVRERAGLVRDSTHMAAKIRWYQRHGRFAAPVRTWHQPTSFVVERLTGAVVFDHGLASTTMLYGLALRDFDPVLLDAFGIDRTRLPGVADAGDAAGALHADGATLCGLR
ncbi:MAG: hypothetical protein KIT73_14900, partial [Burkholderiales bacterium]|nr:hypothetical protein [Burkholderiales bacterium]